MRRLLLALIVAGAAVYAAMPPPARHLPGVERGLAAPVRGALHVHTRRSDGGGTVAQVARGAARAGIHFVILTDHGDGTRMPDVPSYQDGVLVIDAVEVSTEGGHVIALGLPKAPYPLGGEARDAVEDILRLGGVAIAAHPTSSKSDLGWTDWLAPVHGLEYLNGDSEWRDEPAWQLVRALLTYPARRAETLASLLDRPSEALGRWDMLTRTRRVVAVAGVDAHARIGSLGAEEPYTGRLAIPLPGYQQAFRAFSVALPQMNVTQDPAADAGAVIGEIAAGRVFTSIDALAVHPAFEFSASSGAARASAGDVLPLDGPVRLHVRVQGPADARIVLLRDGVEVVERQAASLEHQAPAEPAVYRVEVRLPDAPGEPPVPWIVSNPIYVGRAGGRAPPSARPAATQATAVYTDGPANEWTVEHSTSSQAAADVLKALGGTQLSLRYAISGPASSHPFAALVTPAGPAVASHDRVTFRAQADRPMRISVQLRAPGNGRAGERWHRSVFVDTVPREISVFFDDMKPRGATSAPRPQVERVASLLFVVDTVNTAAGTAGQFFLDDVRYER